MELCLLFYFIVFQNVLLSAPDRLKIFDLFLSQYCDYFIPELFELQKFVTSFCLLEHFISQSHMSHNIGIQPRQVFPAYDSGTRNTFFHNI